jgi:hypothetical protein
MPERQQFPDAHRGQRKLNANAFNTLQDTVEALSRPVLGSGLTLTPSGLNLVPKKFPGLWVQITAVNGATPPAYSWTKVDDNGVGGFVASNDFKTGGPGPPSNWPAFDPNGSATIPINSFARLLPANGECYWILEQQQQAGGSDPVFGSSGASHAAGDVPDPGAAAGTQKVLLENGLWSTDYKPRHIEGRFAVPTIAFGANTPVGSSVSIIGTDTCGVIFVNPNGAVAANKDIAVVTFTAPMVLAAVVVVTPFVNSAAPLAAIAYVGDFDGDGDHDGDGFHLWTRDALLANQAYWWNYIAMTYQNI